MGSCPFAKLRQLDLGDMTETIKIIPAQRDDLRALASLIHESWQVIYRGVIADDYLDTMSLEQRHERFVERFDAGRMLFFKMLADGELIGVAVFGESGTEGFEQDGEISAIYLREDCVGKGYGHAFFTRIEQELRLEGYEHFVLTLLPENTRAHRFYLAQGYKEVKRSVLRLGASDYPVVVMRKKA